MLAPSGGRKHCAPTDIFLSVERLEDLYFAIALPPVMRNGCRGPAVRNPVLLPLLVLSINIFAD